MLIFLKNKHTLVVNEFIFKCCVGKKGLTKKKITIPVRVGFPGPASFKTLLSLIDLPKLLLTIICFFGSIILFESRHFWLFNSLTVLSKTTLHLMPPVPR